MAAENESYTIFDNLSTKFTCLLYGRTEKQREHVIKILNDLNDLNYKLPIVTNNDKAVLLIHQCCQIVNPNDEELIEKCCTLIINLLTIQKINLEGRTLHFAIEWTLQALKHSQNSQVYTLRCLESLIRDNVEKLQEFLPQLIGQNGIIIQLTNSKVPQEVQFWAVKCLEAIVFIKDEQNQVLYPKKESYLEICSKIFLKMIQDDKPADFDEIIYCKLQISCLRGLLYIIIQNNNFASTELDILLGISKCYMTYYLFDTEWVKPLKVMPSTLSVADLKSGTSREKKGGKITKQRKQRKSTTNKKNDKRNDVEKKGENLNQNTGYTPATVLENNTIIISDSDFSDSETGKKNKESVMQGRVRQAALNLLLTIIKVIDKHTIFGYWSSFLPDGSPSGNRTLNQCLLMEPSPKGRMATLNVISQLLNGSKPYLQQAEYSTKSFAFTPFSIILGTMVQELHKTLCFALGDSFLPALTQTLKCLALLVQVTPYHKLSPGLITSVITNVRPFIRHRDASVQVAALIVLGCIIASEPVINETIENLLIRKSFKKEKTPEPADIEYADFSSDEDESQLETETFLPWLLEKCLRNLGIKFNSEKNLTNIVPAPVKLESLQVVSSMCRNYFYELLSPYLIQIAKAIELSFNDKYTDLRLHAGRTVDSVGQAMQTLIGDNSKNVSLEKGLGFWQILLNGPLISLLQSEHVSLRAVGCDCLGSIGPNIFEHLPKDKQILVITLLFTSSRDEDNNVKGAAVRALGISVLYPSLREDVGFVMDTAEAIVRTLEESNLNMRIKSSWSLGNLSDALVLNRNCEFMEELPNSVLLQLLLSSIKISDDNDKVKSNAARAIGNLLRLITNELLENKKFKDISEQAIDVLVKISSTSSNMKVRWNSCYAIGNFLRNNVLYTASATWQESVFKALNELVINSHNFKVRINSALALSVPENRSYYGIHYFQIWKSLLDALDNSQNIEDFSEYKHRDNLIDQVCLSLSHLTTFLTVDDLKDLQPILDSHVDAVNIQMHRVQERLVPEKAEILIKANDHVNYLSKQRLNNDESIVIKNLINIFNRES